MARLNTGPSMGTEQRSVLKKATRANRSGFFVWPAFGVQGALYSDWRLGDPGLGTHPGGAPAMRG